MQVERDYTKVINRKYPEGVAIAIAKDSAGKHNPITLGWTMITSHRPPMMAIAVSLTHYSRRVIEEAGEFVLSFPSSSMAEAALSDAVANFECKLESQMETGDHMLFVGRVVTSHMNSGESVKRLYTLAPGYKMGGVRGDI